MAMVFMMIKAVLKEKEKQATEKATYQRSDELPGHHGEERLKKWKKIS